MPPISGDDLSLTYALSNVARCGITRCGATSKKVFVKIDEVQRAYNRPSTDSRVFVESLSISETNGGMPNRASMRTMGFPVNRLIDVSITIGSENRLRKEFGGVVSATTEKRLADSSNTVFDLNCLDYNWLLNALVTGYFTGTADAIAIEWIQTYAPHFSTAKIQRDLPTVTGGISLTNVRLRDALDRLAERVGATWRADYRKRILFGIDAYAWRSGPQTIHAGLRTALFDDTFAISRDRSQQVTRVHCEGGGAEALTDVPAGESIIPIASAPSDWYGDTGGEVIIGDSQQIVSYTGRDEGGAGSLVGPGVTPTNAPTLALGAGAGVDSGEHSVTVVWKTGSGRTLPSPSTTLDVGEVAPPTVAPTAGSPALGAGPDPGAHYYAMTNVTAAGETPPSPVSGTVTTVAGVTDPSSAGAASNPAHTAWGTLTVGHQYSYKYAYADASGNETLPSPASNTVTIDAAQRALIAGIPYSTDARITRINLYRSQNGAVGPWERVNFFGTGSGQAFPYINNYTGGGTFTAEDWVAEGAVVGGSIHTLGPDAPSANATGTRSVPLTGLQVPTDALVTSKRIYGTAAGGSQLKLVASIAVGASSYTVMATDASLGADVPTSNTATANQISVSNIPIGPTGTTDRELYMSPAGGGTRRLALTISNNVATTGTITMSDATLAGQLAEPGSDTSALTQEDGTIVPGATSILTAGVDWARSGGGWAIVGNGQQVVRYTATSGNTLTGVPASGPGSITAPIDYNSTITAAPCLVGVPAGSPSAGSITNTILKGSPVNLWVTVDNLAAQAEVLDRLDPDGDSGGLAGIVADVISDQRIGRDEALARAAARLDSQDDEHVTLEITSLDGNARAGADLSYDNGSSPAEIETLKIQEVEMRWVDADPPIMPIRTVSASSKRFTFEDLLRRARENT